MVYELMKKAMFCQQYQINDHSAISAVFVVTVLYQLNSDKLVECGQDLLSSTSSPLSIDGIHLFILLNGTSGVVGHLI